MGGRDLASNFLLLSRALAKTGAGSRPGVVTAPIRGWTRSATLLLVVALLPAGNSAASTETVLYSFCSMTNCSDGVGPQADLIADSNGNLYGTTVGGGGFGFGTVFELSPPATAGGPWTETVLYSFSGPPDGVAPVGTLVADSSGNLYGTTYNGGGYRGGPTAGVAFMLAATGKESVLYTFCSQPLCSDGGNPTGLIDSNGNLYGTTQNGGALGHGVVFQLSPYTVLYRFCTQGFPCTDGATPSRGRLLADGGNLYGTTLYGGASGAGTIFKLTPGGKETVLYSFCSQPNCSDGAQPVAGLIADSAGNLYGTTGDGGASGAGVVFEVMPDGTETVLYSFCSMTNCSDGAAPFTSLIADGKGNLYGTTSGGGASNNGVVFKVTPGCQTAAVPPPIRGSHWYQLDSNWAGFHYNDVSGPDNDIGHQGCALVALNYALNSVGQNYNPLTLNNKLNTIPNAYSAPEPNDVGSGGRINNSTAVLGLLSGLKFDKTYSGPFTTQALDSYLCSSDPHPVLVRVSNPTSGHVHSVVVTGKTGGSYSIVDPGYLSRTSLSYYNPLTIDGVVKISSGNDPSELDFSVVDNATLLVTAPDGTQTGFDPSTGQVLKGSPQSAYFAIDNAVDTDVVSIPPTSTTYSVQWGLPPVGTYTVQLNGLAVATYALAVNAFDANGNPGASVTVPGIAGVGSISSFQVQFSPSSGSATVSSAATFNSTLQDISNSLQLGLIDNQGIANSLSSKINAASVAETGGDTKTAANVLGAFTNEVDAQTGKHITGIAPQVLLADAAALINQLQ